MTVADLEAALRSSKEQTTALEEQLHACTAILASARDEMRVLGEVASALNAAVDLETVLRTIIGKGVELSASDAGGIYIYVEKEGRFELRATAGSNKQSVVGIRGQRVDRWLVAEAVRRRAPVQYPDLKHSDRPPILDTVLAAGYRALLVVPLLSADRVVGALIIRRHHAGVFPEHAINVLQTFASQTVVAVETARLNLEIEEKSHDLVIASEHKSLFLANMSHELRTPMNAILGYTELMIDGIYGELPAKVRTVLERVDLNGKHLLGLINDVLDLSKIEAGRLVLHQQMCSLHDIAYKVSSTVEPLALEKNLEFRLSLPADLPAVHGDERRLTQVLLNLVGNAIKFTDRGYVEVASEASDGIVNVAVRDTGPGIAPSDQELIFEEFQQAYSPSTREKGGTGLGLALSRRIVEMHGGRLWVESAVGKGSTFVFTLPSKQNRGEN